MAKSKQWETIHSSKRMNWRTPTKLFEKLDREFSFKLDAAADHDNHLCDKYLTLAEDSLSLPEGKWSELAAHGSVWLNPPYGRDVGTWIDRAIAESKEGSTIVVLTFACTETRWFKRAWDNATEVRFIHGRLKFVDPSTKKVAAAAPKGSCLFVFEQASREHFTYPKLPLCSLFEV